MPNALAADSPHDPQPQPRDATEELTVVGERSRELITFTLSPADVDGIPGIQDDPVRAITILPGVTSNSDVEGGVAIRGSRPGDNGYYLDFLPIAYLFHLTGLSVVDADTTRNVALHPVAYPASYDGVVGGVITVDSRDPARDRTHALVDASLLHAGAMIEGPITAGQRGFISGRVSYYDVVIGSYIKEQQEDENEGIDLVQLPKYWDYRARYQIDIGQHSTLDFFADGASDDVELLFADDAADVVLDPVLAGRHRFGIESHRQGLVLNQPQSRGGHLTAGLGLINTTINGSSGDRGDIKTESTQIVGRVAQRFALSPSHEVLVGGQFTHLDLNYDIAVRDNGCTEFDVDCRFSDDDFTTTNRTRTSNAYSAFSEYVTRPFEATKLTLGLGYRVDDYLDADYVEPRVRLDVSLNTRWGMSLAAGRHSQAPAFEYTEPELGNPRLDHLIADHYIAGLHYGIPGLTLSFDTYYKEFDDLVTSNPTTRYDDRGEGRAWGVDFFAKLNRGAWAWWLSLSYAESTRYDPDTGDRFEYAYDQPIVASVLAKYSLNERLSMSARASYHTGPPYTRIVAGTPDPSRPGAFLPQYAPINDSRYPNYFRLDLRMDWFLTNALNSKFYVELINATNRDNVLDYEYSHDYSTRKEIEQLPTFISVGISKRW
jgi:hypothetical protein